MSRDPDFSIPAKRSGRVGENKNEHHTSMRMTTRRVMKEGGKTRLAEDSFVRDAGKIWNQSPKENKDPT